MPHLKLRVCECSVPEGSSALCTISRLKVQPMVRHGVVYYSTLFVHHFVRTIAVQSKLRSNVHFCRRQNARKEEKEMYEMANKTRQEDAGAGRSSNRADKPVSILMLSMFNLAFVLAHSSPGVAFQKNCLPNMPTYTALTCTMLHRALCNMSVIGVVASSGRKVRFTCADV